MCGEMAGDPRYIPLLLGMGLRQLSMQPRALLEAKLTVRASRLNRLRSSVERLFSEIDGDDPGGAIRALGIVP